MIISPQQVSILSSIKALIRVRVSGVRRRTKSLSSRCFSSPFSTVIVIVSTKKSLFSTCAPGFSFFMYASSHKKSRKPLHNRRLLIPGVVRNLPSRRWGLFEIRLTPIPTPMPTPMAITEASPHYLLCNLRSLRNFFLARYQNSWFCKKCMYCYF